MFRKALSLSALVLFASAPMAMAQGVITDGNASFEFLSSTTHGFAEYLPDGGTNHIFQNWWFFRVDGAPSESPMTWPPASQSYVGNVATLGGTEAGGALSWELELTLTDGALPDQAAVVEWMELTNNTADPMSVALFNYADFDMAGSFGGDSATLISPTELEITEGATFARFAGVGADNWQVTAFSTLRGLLLDGGVTTLTDSGAPFGPGDFTGAFEWNLVIDPGASVRVRENLYINQTVPEPASLCLLVLGGLAVMRRRG